MKLSRSRTLSNRKRRVNQQGVSRKLSGLPSNKLIDQENTLLGNLFIDIEEDHILDITNNYDLTIENINITQDPHGLYNSPYLSFNEQSYIEVNNLLPHLGIEDFTIDWWEYVSKEESQDVKNIFSLSGNNISPLLITNDEHNKNIFMSSNGSVWDISNNKFIGELDHDKWTHWSVSRCNKNFYTYKNGKVTNIWINESALDNAHSNFIIGSKDGNGFKGYISKFRITLDFILWTEEFKTTRNELFY